MEVPFVSIITPTFNSAKFIAQTIQSVQNQTYNNWELIIVDDCSTDRTISIINDFIANDKRIYLYQLNQNSGAGIARNLAIEKANGRFIAFLDSDDLWKPEKLNKQVNFLISNNLPFTFSYYESINEEGNPIHKITKAPKNLTYKQLFFCNFVGNLTGIYDVNYFGKIPISKIRKRQDWIVWLTILKKIKAAKPFPESLAYYRIRTDSISASKIGLLKSNYSVYRQFHQLNIFMATLCMVGFLFVQLFVKPRYSQKIKTS